MSILTPQHSDNIDPGNAPLPLFAKPTPGKPQLTRTTSSPQISKNVLTIHELVCLMYLLVVYTIFIFISVQVLFLEKSQTF